MLVSRQGSDDEYAEAGTSVAIARPAVTRIASRYTMAALKSRMPLGRPVAAR